MKQNKSQTLSPKQSEMMQVAVALHQAGQLDAAELQYRKLLKVVPNNTALLSNLGTIAIQKNQLESAEKFFERSLFINPNQGNILNNYGIVLKELKKLDKALSSFNRAIALVPDYIDAYFNRSITLYELNRLEDALLSFDYVIALKPDYANAHFNRGVTLHDLKRLDEALDAYKFTISLMPDYFAIYFKCGLILHELNNLQEALAYFDCAISLKSDYGDAYFNRGNTLCGLKRLDEALANYDQAIVLDPDNVFAYITRANVLQHLKRLDDALANYDHVISIKPDHAEAYSNRANVLHDLKRLKEAELSCRIALQIEPEFAQAHNNLGLALLELGHLEEAEASFLMAIKYNSNYAEAFNSLGVVSSRLGRLNSEYFKKSLALSPDQPDIFSNWLFNASMSANLNAKELLAEHLLYGEKYEAHLRADWQSHEQNKDPQRCLKIGFVSGDLCDHVLINSLEPLLIHLSKLPSLSLHAYYNHIKIDNVTQRLQNYFSSWISVVALTHTIIVDKIRADGIDILIDLSGHTARNLLPTFARKPAPIQITWMGYPGTTGLKAMDYTFVDRFLMLKDLFTEKLVYLPAAAPFSSPVDAPDVSVLPALRNGYITFGSFNRVVKYNAKVIAVWAKLMQALPTSRLRLNWIPESSNDIVIAWFAECGIQQDRLSFHPRSNIDNFLELHQEVDIGLDTFPYGGSTTTCQALWMGVPTLTMVEETIASRMASIWLNQVGLNDFIADNEEDFLNKGLSVANDLERLAKLRMELRTRFKRSPIQQPELIAKNVEHAFRYMWQRWCDGLLPISFDVSDTLPAKGFDVDTIAEISKLSVEEIKLL